MQRQLSEKAEELSTKVKQQTRVIKPLATAMAKPLDGQMDGLMGREKSPMMATSEDAIKMITGALATGNFLVAASGRLTGLLHGDPLAAAERSPNLRG